MKNEDFPALFQSADAASDEKQKLFLRLIRAEYFSLICAAVLAIDSLKGPTTYMLYAVAFVVLIVLSLVRAFLRPEQDWYRARALAESVKTLAWRYVMRAAPFEDAPSLSVVRTDFQRHLQSLFDANRELAALSPGMASANQITDVMRQVRSMPLAERVRLYKRERVSDQRSWYSKKATANRRSARRWVCIGIGTYVIAGIFVLIRIRLPNLDFWPIEPLIVFASSVIGWMQVKKFNELSAAYSVTAQEVGLIEPKLEDVNTENHFSDFVNEAELAFSREHTMWLARKTQ